MEGICTLPSRFSSPPSSLVLPSVLVAYGIRMGESTAALQLAMLFRATILARQPGESRGACPGYVIDQIRPLACGGADEPENMQWHMRQAALEKDRWERRV